MKLTAQRVIEAVPVITQIINDKRPMPLKGKYRLSRLIAKLLPEFQILSAQKDDLIRSYDFHPTVQMSDDGLVPSETFTVPDDKIEDFMAKWKPIAETEIEVDVEPVPIRLLDLGDEMNGSIEAHEIIALGELICE